MSGVILRRRSTRRTCTRTPPWITSRISCTRTCSLHQVSIRSLSPLLEASDQHDCSSFAATTGLNDYRVAYWEPAKFVATLRHVNAARRARGDRQSLILLKTKMDSGHGGASGAAACLCFTVPRVLYLVAVESSSCRLGNDFCAGRYSMLEEKSFEYAFVLNQLGLAAL